MHTANKPQGVRAAANTMGEEKEKKGDGEKKTKRGGMEDAVEVKLDLHCDGCAKKVWKAVKILEGVVAVSVDPANNRLKAIGKVDPWKLKEFLEAKTKKKVDFIFPKDPPKKPKGEEMKKKDEDAKDKNQKKSSDDKKPKPPASSTVVLKIRLHCDGCIQRIKRHIHKIKGVEEVTVDAAKDVVTVKGTMDLKTLPAVLEDRLKRGVEIVPAKKDDGGRGGEKKEKGNGSGGEKKKKEGRVVEGNKEETTTTVAEANKMEYYGPHGGFEGYGYFMEMVHAPQMFSDENPNACSVM